MNLEMWDGLGDWIGRQLQMGMEAQGEMAAKKLKTCKIPLATLHNQWEDQQWTQLSVGAHK